MATEETKPRLALVSISQNESPLPWLPIIIAGVLGFMCSKMVDRIRKSRNKSAGFRRAAGPATGRYDVNNLGPCKMMLVVRTDLGMTKGKIAAQAGHASIGAYLTAQQDESQELFLRQWYNNAQPKIAVQVGSEKECLELQRKAGMSGLNTYVVQDAGRTQIAAGSLTVLAIGPGPAALIDPITRHLKLL